MLNKMTSVLLYIFPLPLYVLSSELVYSNVRAALTSSFVCSLQCILAREDNLCPSFCEIEKEQFISKLG